MPPVRKRRSLIERGESVDRMTAHLKRQYWPRMTMMMVVALAAGTGFLLSAVMLWMGMRYMPVRYALAGIAGYGVFLALMNQWLGRQLRSSLVDRAADVDGALDVSGAILRGGSGSVESAADGLFRGGRSGGGGASASFDDVASPSSMQPLPLMAGGDSRGFSLDLDDNDSALPLLAVIAIAAGVIACASVIWQAPQMLAELLVDGAVAGTAYRSLRLLGEWTPHVMRRTILPAAFIIVVFVLLGVAGHWLEPEADSIGGFFR
jgi:hypothetical protein